MSPPKDWLGYSNHIMTDGRMLGHPGYGGQFLMVDMASGTSCAFWSVLENEAGYDDAYMGQLSEVLRDVCLSVSESAGSSQGIEGALRPVCPVCII